MGCFCQSAAVTQKPMSVFSFCRWSATAVGNVWWTGQRGALNWLCCVVGPPGLLFDNFHMYLKAKIHSKMLHTRGPEPLLCVFMPLPAWKPSFTVMCLSLSLSLSLALFFFRKKISFCFLFAQDLRKWDTFPIWRIALVPRVWKTLLLGDTVTLEGYQNSPGNAKHTKEMT